MTWTYSQKSGVLTSPDQKTWQCYAGRDDGKNNPDKQSVHNLGPLPQGQYKFGLAQQGTHLGPNAIPLIPDPKNTMFGRSGFFVHADNPAHIGASSDGCIIAPFTARVAIIASPVRTLTVTA